MEDPQEQSQGRAEAPQPLGYVRPLHYMEPVGDVLERRARRNAVVSGALMSGLVVVAGVFLVIMAAVSGTNPGIVIGIGIVVVASATVHQHFVRRRKGFLAGVLIGIGIAALIEGACFVALIR